MYLNIERRQNILDFVEIGIYVLSFMFKCYTKNVFPKNI